MFIVLRSENNTMDSFVRFLLMLIVYTMCHESIIVATDDDVDTKLPALQHVKIIDANELQVFKHSKLLSMVYFFSTDAPQIKAPFYKVFDDSAKYLNVYEISCAVVDCITLMDTVEECKDKSIGKNVFAFQNGVELIKLELDTMFDVNSIMGNALQLSLLREVPILESLSDRENLQASLVGKQDLILFYTHAIGTLYHRIFMEIAYSYQGHYKFALFTKVDTASGLQDNDTLSSDSKSAIWTLYCSVSEPKSEEESYCRSVLFRGVLSLSTLASYMKRLPKPNLFPPPNACYPHIFEETSDLPSIYIFTNKSLLKHTDDISTNLSYDAKGFAKIIIVDVENKDCYTIASNQGFDGHIPHVAVAIPGGKLTFMEKKDHLDLLQIHSFLTTLANVPTPREEVVTIPEKPGVDFVVGSDSNGWDKHVNLIKQVETEDDEVAKDIFESKKKGMKEIMHLPAVLKGNFKDVVLNAKLKVVLYYLPYDAVSLAFLSDFDAAAEYLSSEKNTKDILARVNCFDATDLCGKENITTYPVVRIHKADYPYQTYEGPLDTLSIVKAVKLLSHDFPIKLKNEDELDQFIKGTHAASSSVIFVTSKNDEESLSVFEKASLNLAPFVAMAEVDGNLGDIVARNYGSRVPAVISLHHKDEIQPVRILDTVEGVDQVITFVKQASIQTVPELTATTFPTLFAKNLPFVILFLNQSSPGSDDIQKTLGNLATTKMNQDSIVCWMDVQQESMGMTLLKEYTNSTTIPTIAVVNHRQATVFTKEIIDVKLEELVDWTKIVFDGNVEPSKLLEDKEWSAPGPYYNFLEMIDKEAEEAAKQGVKKEDGQQLKFVVGLQDALGKEEKVRRMLLKKKLHQTEATELKDSKTLVVEEKTTTEGDNQHEEL